MYVISKRLSFKILAVSFIEVSPAPFWVPEFATSSLVGVDVAFSERVQATLLEWIPFDGQLRAIKRRSPSKINCHRSHRCNLLVVSANEPTDFKAGALNDCFYQRLHNLLRTGKRGDIVIFAGDMNARVVRLSSNQAHLGDTAGPDKCHFKNGERLLGLCSDHLMALASTNLRCFSRRYVTWNPLSWTQLWNQINHIAISY